MFSPVDAGARLITCGGLPTVGVYVFDFVMPFVRFVPVSETDCPTTLPTFTIWPPEVIETFGAWIVAAMLPICLH